jgi:hypothetical protein
MSALCAGVVLSAVLVGCVGIEDHPTPQQLVGRWQVDDEYGHVTLVLSADGKYSEETRDHAGRTQTVTGTWSNEVAGVRGTPQPHLILHDALVPPELTDPVGRPAVGPWLRQDWLLWTVRDWGTPGLSPHPDLGSFTRD